MKMKPMLGDETEDQNPGGGFAAKNAREVYERSVRFAEVGVTHVVHLLGGDGLPMAWREFRRSCHPNPPCDQHEYSRLIESLPEAWLITLRDAVLNRPRPIDWQECVRTSDLPGNAWTCMNDNGQGRRWVAPTQGEAPVFEWMETGELRATTQDETGAPSLATVRERGAGGWCEVEV